MSTITKISDELWGMIVTFYHMKNQKNTIGRPTIPFRKVLDGIFYVLRTGCLVVEDVVFRIWLWFYMSSSPISTMG